MPQGASIARTAPMRRVPLYIDKLPRLGNSPGRRAGSRRDTGFSRAVRLAVRERAGNCCECHSIWLGDNGGELQHRVARGMGGRKSGAPPWINGVANGVLMCVPGHRDAESRSAHMHERGFWLRSGEDPRLVPVMLHGLQGGIAVWLTADGRYSARPPDEEAA